jgi:hypothetical protein
MIKSPDDTCTLVNRKAHWPGSEQSALAVQFFPSATGTFTDMRLPFSGEKNIVREKVCVENPVDVKSVPGP